ncbi:MAG TPA: hypothetical protein VF510_26465 [Ktedonobacterales bacterium]
MTDVKRTKWRSGAAKGNDQTTMHDTARALELRAIEEQFLAEQRAGLDPRLSTYLQRYPDYGAELAAFIALTFVPRSQVGGALLFADDSATSSHEHRIALSSGTRRALDDIFGRMTEKTIPDQARVAERPTPYVHEAPPTTPVGDADDHEQ